MNFMKGTVHVFEFLDSPSAELPAGVCPVFGGERFLKRLVIGKLANNDNESSEYSVTQLEGDQATWADVNDELSTRSLFGGDGPKIVVVDDADKFVSNYRDRIEDFHSAKEKSGVLMLIVSKWASNTRLYKAIHKNGLQIRCDAPMRGKSKQPDQGAIQKWLIARAKADYDFMLPAAGAATLIELTDSEFGRMDQELQKLALYVDDKGKLDVETVRMAVGGWRTQTMWDAIDAATEGDAATALKLLDRMLQSGEHPLALFGQLAWSLRRYSTATEIVLRDMRHRRKPNLPGSLKDAGFNSWGGEIDKASSRIKQLGRHRAGLMLDWLLDADGKLKRSHSRPERGRLVLETLFLRMAKELGPAA